MRFSESDIPGAFVIDLERHEDERGFFARIFSQDDFEAHGLEPVIAQSSVAFNRQRGTIRGMHFQYPPAAETKYVRCTRGAILDVIVDLRPESPTYLQHVSVELTEENGRGVYVPRRFAHGYQVLQDNTETSYMIGDAYSPADAGGLSYDDPRLGLSWPLPVTQISDRDLGWLSLDRIEPELIRRMTTGGPA